MAFGSAAHCCFLEPGRFEKDYAIQTEKIDRRTKAGKQAADYLAETFPNVTFLDPEEYDSLLRMRDNALADPIARRLLEEPGRIESSLHTIDPETGLPIKVRFDKILSDTTVVDLKFMEDVSPDGFSRACLNFGYFRQEAFYRSALEVSLGADAVDFMPFAFLTFGKNPPYPCVVYVSDPVAREWGRQENRREMLRLKDCYDFNQWRDPQFGRVNTVSLPYWMTRNATFN